ncbi:MAG TPA: carbohydrate kinase family protein [Candidatus Saccharimonadia bacterium]|nr:carbohydrate kinase family protein [Candidatus Saccharimonadia bacterium]
MDAFDVLSVGDVVVDEFIRLINENAHEFENQQGKWLAIPFGVKIPFEKSILLPAVGNASNASVNFAKFGLKSGLISNVGHDKYGIEVLDALHAKKVDNTLVRVNSGKLTNHHYVLWYKEERTILIKHEAYDYYWPHLRAKEIPKWLYFSSISGHAMGEYTDQICAWLSHNEAVKLAFQPGTFQLEAGTEKLKDIYKRTEILILNREEAVIVSKHDSNEIHGLLDKLHALGPKSVIITDGPSGAYASDGTKRIKMPPYPDPKPPFERTGAGDAFASTLVAALIKGYDFQAALELAPISSMNVVQYVGAQEGLLSEHELIELLKKAPRDYKIENF